MIDPVYNRKRTRLRVRPIFAWYDLWIGVFVDVPKRRLYVFPIPMCGVVVEVTRV